MRDESGRETKITRRQRSAFDVGRAQTLPVSAGEQLLIRGHDKDHGFANGDLKTVASVDPEKNRVVFTDGGELPPSFAAWTYGHAQTSYRSQGSTSEESLMVLGEVATRALKLRQFYVGNTRYRGRHAIYVSDRAEILRRLSRPDDGRELATEFVKRNRIVMDERVGHRRDLRTRMAGQSGCPVSANASAFLSGLMASTLTCPRRNPTGVPYRNRGMPLLPNSADALR